MQSSSRRAKRARGKAGYWYTRFPQGGIERKAIERMAGGRGGLIAAAAARPMRQGKHMVLGNKLGISSDAELAREEERLTKVRALELFERGLLDELEAGTFAGLAEIHAYLFQDIYDFAGACVGRISPRRLSLCTLALSGGGACRHRSYAAGDVRRGGREVRRNERSPTLSARAMGAA